MFPPTCLLWLCFWRPASWRCSSLSFIYLLIIPVTLPFLLCSWRFTNSVSSSSVVFLRGAITFQNLTAYFGCLAVPFSKHAGFFFLFFLMFIISSQISVSMLIGVFLEDVSLNLLCFLRRLFFQGIRLHLPLSWCWLSPPAGCPCAKHNRGRGGRSRFSVAGRRRAFPLSTPGE